MAHGPLERSREQDHEVVETAVQAGEKKQRAVVWQRREDRERRTVSLCFQVLIAAGERLRPARTSGVRIIGGKTAAAAVLQLVRTHGEDGVMATAGIICVHFL